MLPVVFDLDGTLIDSLPDIAAAVNVLLAEEGLPPLEVPRVAGFIGHGVQVLMQRLIAATELDAGDHDRLLARFIPIYEEAARETRLMPGAAAALDVLRARGVPLGLCTNKPRAPLLPTLAAAGLEGAFDIVLAGDDLAFRKPDPRTLLHVVQALGAESCVYVGDSPVDAETARAAGVPFALYTEGIRVVPVAEIPHDRAFSDFSELAGVYDALRGAA